MAAQSERDHYRNVRRRTNARVLRSCPEDIEREIHEVLGPIGVDEKVSNQVAHNLLEIEMHVNEPHNESTFRSSLPAADLESKGMQWNKDVGVTPFLLKFGEGMGMLNSFMDSSIRLNKSIKIF